MTEKNFFSDKFTEEFNPFVADNKTLFELSLKLANGDGVETDFVAAHICLNIATMRGCQDAAEYRKELAFDMSPKEISKAQKEARSLMAMIKNNASN
ncbi:MAG: hypothetical protein ACJARD_001157 [Alphaproteobacteria bacterium]|jgi:hypothetical protein